MAVSAKMLSLLRDPVGLDPLELDGDYLVNRAGQRRYPIIESIPVLLEPAGLGPQNLKSSACMIGCRMVMTSP